MSILNEIRFNNLKGDLFGGVTAAVIALPMALAFGVASGAGAIAGRYGAVLVGLFASLSGGTGPLIFEQVGTLTVVTTAPFGQRQRLPKPPGRPTNAQAYFTNMTLRAKK